MPSQFAKCVGTFTKFLLAKKCFVLLSFLGLSTNIIGYCHFFYIKSNKLEYWLLLNISDCKDRVGRENWNLFHKVCCLFNLKNDVIG